MIQDSEMIDLLRDKFYRMIRFSKDAPRITFLQKGSVVYKMLQCYELLYNYKNLLLNYEKIINLPNELMYGQLVQEWNYKSSYIEHSEKSELSRIERIKEDFCNMAKFPVFDYCFCYKARFSYIFLQSYEILSNYEVLIKNIETNIKKARELKIYEFGDVFTFWKCHLDYLDVNKVAVINELPLPDIQKNKEEYEEGIYLDREMLEFFKSNNLRKE